MRRHKVRWYPVLACDKISDGHTQTPNVSSVTTHKSLVISSLYSVLRNFELGPQSPVHKCYNLNITYRPEKNIRHTEYCENIPTWHENCFPDEDVPIGAGIYCTFLIRPSRRRWCASACHSLETSLATCNDLAVSLFTCFSYGSSCK